MFYTLQLSIIDFNTTGSKFAIFVLASVTLWLHKLKYQLTLVLNTSTLLCTEICFSS